MTHARAGGTERMIAQPSLEQPHTLIFFVAALLCLAIALVPLFSSKEIGTQRRIYWGGTGGAALCFFLASLPDLGTGALLILGSFVFMAIPAYFSGPLIKVGGRVFAFRLEHSRSGRTATGRDDSGAHEPPSDSYGGNVTASKLWWLLIFVVGLCASTIFQYVIDTEKVWIVVVSAVALVTFAVMYGVADGSWGHRVARGQYVQFGIITIMTIGTFTALYLAAYFASRRRPIRRRDPFENRGHSRHQKRTG